MPLSRRQLRAQLESQTSVSQLPDNRVPDWRSEVTPGADPVALMDAAPGLPVSLVQPPATVPSASATLTAVSRARELTTAPTESSAVVLETAAIATEGDTRAAGGPVPNTAAGTTRALMTMAGAAASTAGQARQRARSAMAAFTTDADRTVQGPVYRSTFVAVAEAAPAGPVVAAPSAIAVWLLALLPLVQLAIIAALGPLHLGPGIGYTLLIGPSLGFLLVAATRRVRANGRNEQPTTPMLFAAVPPLYRLPSSLPLTAATMAPVITWLLLAGIAAAVLLFA